MPLPTQEECLALIREMGMLPNIKAHSVQVCRVALYLADRLAEGGVDLDRRLVETSALLHDITKTRSLATGENHAATGADLARERGWPRVAVVIAQHVILTEAGRGGVPDEADVVNYADKRVLHDRIVSLSERMDYILVRYGRGPEARERILRNWRSVSVTEAKLFRRLTLAPSDLDAAVAATRIPVGESQDAMEGILSL